MGASAPAPAEARARLLEEIRRRHSLLKAAWPDAAAPGASRPDAPAGCPASAKAQAGMTAPRWGPVADPQTHARLQAQLEAFGLLPEYAAEVAAQAAQRLGPRAPSAHAQWEAVRAVLAQRWRPTPPVCPGWQVWLGAPGVGTTTCLSKWLVRQALPTGPRLEVWRLDLVRANTAEALTVLAEACGLPVHRTWPQRPEADPDTIHLVDLPGLDWQEPQTRAELECRLAQLPQPQVHLVLNAAYEVRLWLAQIQAFAVLPISDLTFSHLDEQPHWGKLWNGVLSAKLPLGFLSAGQNVPGQWRAATLEELLPRQGTSASALADPALASGRTL